MAKMTDPEKQYRDYLRSDRWKCNKSPTGAHHWVEHGGQGIYICKWCFDVRRFPQTFDTALEHTYGKKLPYVSLKDERVFEPRMQNPIPLKGRRRKQYGDN